MSVHSLNDGPADRVWPVTRGDDNIMLLYFFDVYKGKDHPDNVPADLSGFTYISSVSTGRETDHTLMVSPTVSVGDPGELIVSMTDTQGDLLTKSTYVWDLVEDPNTTTEVTLIGGRMTVSGRATP